jgi:flagellar M-ring protein FliF
MGFFGNLSQQFRQVWQGMSPGRRVAMAVVGLVTTATVLGVAYWAAQPDYRVLFSGLAPEDASAITTKLQAQGVSFRLSSGGTSVLVPAEQLQQVRVDMAGDGLPVKGGKGFELFDQSPLGMTPFTQHVNYIRAMQAELARTIMSIDPIVFARVHIVKPDPSPFIRDQKPTTASVVVRLKPGTSLSRHVSNGVVALVARSVEGLTRENVTIVDDHGKLLSEEHNPETGMIGSHMDYRRELEKYLSAQAESVLAPVMGTGKALVRVTADINFQRHKEKKETYQPDGRVPTMEKLTTSKATSGPGNQARGPTGTASNLGKPPAPATTAPANNVEETTETNYVVSKVTQEFEDKVGSIERLTIAALVDLSGGEKGEPRMSMSDVQDIIKQAVGFKTGRDDIKVTNVKLPGAPTLPSTDDEVEKVQFLHTLVTLVKNASLGIAALAGLIMVWMVLRRLKPRRVEAPSERSAVLERLATTAQQDPQAIARVLTHWLEQSERPRRQAA